MKNKEKHLKVFLSYRKSIENDLLFDNLKKGFENVVITQSDYDHTSWGEYNKFYSKEQNANLKWFEALKVPHHFSGSSLSSHKNREELELDLSRTVFSGEKILTFLLPSKMRESIIGDLHEDLLTKIAPKNGNLWGKAWYWSQVIRFSLPTIFKGVGVLLALIELYRRFTGG